MTAPNDLIGPYRVISQLGAGAMGEVWRARDERLDRYVALKVLPADAAVDTERRARMLREARAAAAIRHPNVVTLFDIVSEDGDDILVMELVEGRTLSELLRKEGAPSLETALGWIDGVAHALVAAHARGVLHRDIKAANVMVTSDGGVKVLDFGLAKLKGDDAVLPAAREPAGATSNTKLALDATMPSSKEIASYQTHAGQLLGTPLYMAPEQIAGQLPDERSEVFSVGVLAHEILTGKPPYSATTMDALFRQITADEPPSLPKTIPSPVADIVKRALAKDPAERWPSMGAFNAAINAERKRLFAPPVRRWPLVAAILVGVIGIGVGVAAWRSSRPAPKRPGDDLVERALGEYDVFYNDKALSSLRAALAVAPDHPRANAYMILFGGASDADRAKAVEAARRARSATTDGKDRALIDAATTLVERGPLEARATLASAGTPRDRELAFWAAELDYRAANYAAAGEEYKALLAEPAKTLRGRIYDHYSAVLLYVDDPTEALRIGTLYRDALPGEADAVAVYATTLSAAGRHAEAIAAAEEALRLAEGEDTHAGLAKVLALSGDRTRAKEHYRESIGRAGASRRPIRRAALAMLHWMDGELEAARAVTAPCLSPSDPEAQQRERAACVFMAGVVDPAEAQKAIAALDELAAQATPIKPPYGNPASLAKLVRARAKFFGGACVIDAPLPTTADPALSEEFAAPLDFYAAYHVPFFSTWALCERAALLAASGDRTGAAAVLRPAVARAPNRTWLSAALQRYQ